MPEDRAGGLLLQRARRPDGRRRAAGAPGDALVEVGLQVLPGALAIARLEAGAPAPAWASAGGPLVAVVRTAAELSVVCEEGAVPDGVRVTRDWRAIEVSGPLDLAMTGVLASLAVPLADAGVPIFAVSTYDTDYVLVPGARLHDAVAALRAAGHHVDGGRPAGPLR